MAQSKGFQKRQQRVRRAIKLRSGDKPRLSVFRSGKNIYAQIIDDVNGRTLAAASSMEKDIRKDMTNGGNKDAAARIGSLIAERAKKVGVEAVVFDRGGYIYHGRVKALGDAAREGGLVF